MSVLEIPLETLQEMLPVYNLTGLRSADLLDSVLEFKKSIIPDDATPNMDVADNKDNRRVKLKFLNKSTGKFVGVNIAGYIFSDIASDAEVKMAADVTDTTKWVPIHEFVSEGKVEGKKITLPTSVRVIKVEDALTPNQERKWPVHMYKEFAARAKDKTQAEVREIYQDRSFLNSLTGKALQDKYETDKDELTVKKIYFAKI